MVDRILIERIISDIKADIQDLRGCTDITWDVYRTDKRARRYVERTLHITIEACIDIAQHIISDQGFREPTSYRDVFLVLAEIFSIFKNNLSDIELFVDRILGYLERIS